MGKTGSVTWAQVKGVEGQIRLVHANKGKAKKPGPNQKFKRYAILKKISSSQQGDDRRGQRGRRPQRGRRGAESNADVRVRKHIRRSDKSAMGIKTK